MTDAPGPRPTRREQIEERHDKALLALRAALGDRPIEVATVSELATLLARIPSDTPLLVADHVRIDPSLDEGTTESRHAVQATAVSGFADETVEGIDGHGNRDAFTQRIAGLMLGGVLVAQGSPAPARSVAHGASERIVEGLLNGDGVQMIDAFVELVHDIAGLLDGIDDPSLLEWLDDEAVAGQLGIEGSRLRQSAARLAGLRDHVAAGLAAQAAEIASDPDD